MKKIYLLLVMFLFLAVACSSPAKKQHEDRQRHINDLQNVGAGASDDGNSKAENRLTDSTRMDTTGKKK